MALTLRQNPGLQAFSWETRVRDAEVVQAGLFPNPEIAIDVENFAGSGDFSGMGQSETTIALGQRIELGGKRPKRRHVAELEREIAGWDYEDARLEVLTEASKAFTDVLAAQEGLSLAAEILRISEESLAAVSRRVRAGASSAVEQTRAEVSVSATRVEQMRAQTTLLQARTRLVAMWGGGGGANFERAEGDIFDIQVPPTLDTLLPQIQNNPSIARWSHETELRQAVVELEKAKRIPDITAIGGVRRLEETSDSALVFGVVVPLAVIDRNQGAREASRFDLLKAKQERRAEELRVISELQVALQFIEASYAEISILRDSILPRAQQAYEGVRNGYTRGLFRYADVLEAQRTLFELKEQHIESLRAYHTASADIKNLTGSLFQAPRDIPGGNN